MLVLPDEMRRFLSLMDGEMDRRMRPLGLTSAHCQPLLHLLHRPGATVPEVARSCGREPSSTTRLLDRLEDMGLCRRSRSGRDRRVVSVELTPDGLVKASLVQTLSDSVESMVTTGFTLAESEQLTCFTKRILANIDSATDAGQKARRQTATARRPSLRSTRNSTSALAAIAAPARETAG